MDISQLEADVQRYFEQGLASSTHKTYASGIKKFKEFCVKVNLTPTLPVPQQTLCLFIAYLASTGLAYSTITTYLSALRHFQVSMDIPDIQQSNLPKFLLVKRGIRKEKARSHIQKPRLPITPQILLQIKALWSSKVTDNNRVMLLAACCLCFFGFFRLGEITSPSERAFDPGTNLTLFDLMVDNHAHPNYLIVTLKQSKTDQFRKGMQVVVGRTDNELCPLAAVLHYVAIRGPSQGPLFKFKDNKYLTKQNFTTHIRDALATLGYTGAHYAGHSFRIGAATTAAKANLEDSVIRTLGRWESDAFLSYIRIPHTLLAGFSQVLSSTR